LKQRWPAGSLKNGKNKGDDPMNVISEAASGLPAQNAVMKYDGFQTKNDSRTPEYTEPNSFLSIFRQLDVNADDSLDTNELKLGLEGFVANFIFDRDLNGDKVLNSEEAGTPMDTISALDSNSDRVVDGGEIISEAGRILDGLISILDTNNDKILSRDELAIFELFFSRPPSADGNSIFDRSRSSAGETLELDMNAVPDRMRKAGFQGSDNALYYALAHVYNFGPGREMPDDEAGSLAILNTQRDAIYNWFDGEVAKVKDILVKNPRATVTAITHDGRDKCGFRLGPAIMDRLKGFGNRVQLGAVLPDTEY
jgi:hypothetical protein